MTIMKSFSTLLGLELFLFGGCVSGAVNVSEPSGRIIGTNHEPSKIFNELLNPDLLNAGKLMAITLVGTAALISSSALRDDESSISHRRSDSYNGPQVYTGYRDKINHFENRIYDKMAIGVGNAISRVSRVGYNAGRSAKVGVKRVVKGMSRMGRIIGFGLGRMGQSLRRGARVIDRSAARGFRRAFNSVRGASRIAGRNMKGIARRYSHGLRRLSSNAFNFGRKVSRGLTLVSSVATHGVSKLGIVASQGVSRIGEAASVSASRIADVASVVPASLLAVAKERRIQDCLLQTICYVSTPMINSRRGRMLKILSDDMKLSVPEDLERKLNTVSGENQEFRMDDCEVFECRLASLGRKAFGIFSKMRTNRETP